MFLMKYSGKRAHNDARLTRDHYFVFVGKDQGDGHQTNSKGRVIVSGKIHKRVEFWEKVLKASTYVMAIVIYGYSLPFISHCPTFRAKNNASSLRNYEFVSETINELLATKCIKEVEAAPFCCNPLTVSEGEKPRLVLDLRHVNQYLEETRFRYENLETVKKIFGKNYYFCSYDLSSAYHHISVNPDHYKYLGFSWIDEMGRMRYFVFVVVPFGLSTACYALSKIMRPLVKKWRSAGIRCVAYLDDGIFGSKSFSLTSQHAKTVAMDLEAAGFTINTKKSNFYPTQVGVWLGFLINIIDYTFSAPQEKVNNLMRLISEALSIGMASAREMARIAGTIISMGPGIGPLTRLFTRKMYGFVEDMDTWGRKQKIDVGSTEELKFWKGNLNAINGYKIKDEHIITKVIYSDASDYAYGGYIVQKLGNIISHGMFSNQDQKQSSTYRELLAAKKVLLSFANQLEHHTVLWHSDNTNVAKIINYGSP